MNVLSFVGNLGQDSELKYLPSGAAILNFSVACSSGYGDKKKTTWVRCALFGKQGEALAQYLKKGSKCFVSGEFSLNEYTANDGTKKTSVELNVNSVSLEGGKSDSPAQGQQPAQSQNAQPRGNQPTQGDNFDAPYDDSNIPF